MDQIQQNFITPTNHKKIWGYFWWGFSELGQKQQNQARKHGVGAPKTWSTWLMIPRWCRAEPYGADLSRLERIPTKNTRRGTREITWNTRETLNQREYGHTWARSSEHNVIQDPNPTRDDTKGNRFFFVRRSWWGYPRGGLVSPLVFRGSSICVTISCWF